MAPDLCKPNHPTLCCWRANARCVCSYSKPEVHFANVLPFKLGRGKQTEVFCSQREPKFSGTRLLCAMRLPWHLPQLFGNVGAHDHPRKGYCFCQLHSGWLEERGAESGLGSQSLSSETKEARQDGCEIPGKPTLDSGSPSPQASPQSLDWESPERRDARPESEPLKAHLSQANSSASPAVLFQVTTVTYATGRLWPCSSPGPRNNRQ